MNVMPTEKKTAVEALLREGNAIREISRKTGAAPESVRKIHAELCDAGEVLVCKCGRDISHKGRCFGRREGEKASGETSKPLPRPKPQQAVSSIVPALPLAHPPLTRDAIMGFAEEIKKRYREKIEELVAEHDEAVTMLERFLELVEE